ncbi:hypothetical protein L1F30_06755 [Simiduia sp. 21SJ11W-1]|uniref:hypothetical protein n=1 Tax=Simiduia sp. 21SJ11W-1 TaxID=2909669 RepID=UPI0020A13CB3|nr:hypothetical protein [Simiduia sp. 21SJ11W-1]UTA49234.1 hypothetical protein L1F30_06755 [Simiduia sp. 21SJ11W-1]
MIEFRNERARQFVAEHAQSLGDTRSLQLLQTGVQSPNDATHLAQLYWAIVDAPLEDNVEYLLEQAYSALHIHCGNKGFESAWEQEIPE